MQDGLLDLDPSRFDLAGTDAWCAGCGHWYGCHLFGGCEELIPCAGLTYACTCPAFVAVTDALYLDPRGQA